MKKKKVDVLYLRYDDADDERPAQYEKLEDAKEDCLGGEFIYVVEVKKRYKAIEESIKLVEKK